MTKKHLCYCISSTTADELVAGLLSTYPTCEATFDESPDLGYEVFVKETFVETARTFAAGFFYALSSRP